MTAIFTLTPTRILGATASGFALSSCAVAWFKSRTAKPPRLVLWLAVLEAALLLDMVFNGRWLLHDLLSRLAMADHRYGQRSGPQHIALGVVGILLGLLMGLAVYRFRCRPGATVAVCGGILSICCWFVEVISLHGVDRVFYSRMDGVSYVRLFWSACSLLVGLGVLWDSFAVPQNTDSSKPAC